MITLHDVKVWDTGEVIDLVIPGTAALVRCTIASIFSSLSVDPLRVFTNTEAVGL